MRRILVYATLLLLVVSCGNRENNVVKIEDGQLTLVFYEQSTSSFFSDRIFGEIEMSLLETTDNCIVGRNPDLKIDDHHYFIRDYQQYFFFRFDRSGKFINKIGSRGGGPGEYSEINDFDIDPETNTLEVLTMDGQIMKYNYDGTFLSSTKFGEDITAFIKTGDIYWINLGTSKLAHDGRLLKVSKDGTVIEKYLPLETEWPLIIDLSFSRSGNIINFKENFNHTMYRITDNGPVATTIIDFGNYDIPKSLFNMDFRAGIDELRRKGYAGIDVYLENNKFVYIHFRVIQGTDGAGYYWLVNKNTGNSVMQKFTVDDPLFVMMEMEGAKILTHDNELVFIANAQMLRECADPFFNSAAFFKDSLSDDSNPIILSLKINDF